MALAGTRRARCVATAMMLVSVTACSHSDSTAVGTTTTVTVATTRSPTTLPPNTEPVSLPTSAPAARRSADELAGARVLCSYAGAIVPDDLLTRVRQGKAAGVLWYGDNLPDMATAVSNAAAIQRAASAAANPAPAIVGTDQEGGDIRRIQGPPEASAQTLGVEGPATIHDQAKAAAVALLQWGINVNLAPVADIGRSGSFEAAQGRSFGTDPNAVAADVVAFVRGLHDGGAAATLKHFPGLGAATTNTDVAPSIVDVPAATLRSTDIPPFTSGIGAGADLVMLSSAHYPALDSVPAVVSRAIVHDILRSQLGFGGVIMSDAFDSDAVAALGPIGSAAVAAANAGVDLFISRDAAPCAVMQEALAAAITDGRIPRADAEATYDRILRLRRGLSTG
ncbi:MAG: beta-N-acetylhexosaminidase [Actinobacteria bacterium]|nr:MAG: beta-N-acetylhexosaminidase [Actinomycetota bacterium]